MVQRLVYGLIIWENGPEAGVSYGKGRNGEDHINHPALLSTGGYIWMGETRRM